MDKAAIHVRKLVSDIGGEIFTATDRWVDSHELHEAGWLLSESGQHGASKSNVRNAKFKPGDQVQVQQKQRCRPNAIRKPESVLK